MTTAIRLIVLRHAKSAWPDVDDRDRPLAPRGRRDAPVAGRWLRDEEYVPDLVICSPARRTRETWDLVAAEFDADPPVIYDERVYDAWDAGLLLGLIRETPHTVRTLLLIGHNPGMQDLTLELAHVDGSEALRRAEEKFPTSAIAVLTHRGPWTTLASGSADLTAFHIPRGVKS